ncbi:hypothetical protein [Nonomuraea rhodomycinica]|uniref:Uncharacterized protein n=1 Tax=Nonomuraea rhodomycinica TaxID=1712872 RepID=A0A7Y6MBP8_9ACTN|nr:hypothetical protein [Nonomuraea rhodomycinica]NUW41927.1 hypothetical protein [Nonomuraea rhodomycinica]
MLEIDCLNVTKEDTIGCGQLGAAFIECFKKATVEKCTDMPKEKCEKHVQMGGNYTKCTWEYSATQAWLMKNLVDAVDVATVCGLSGISGPSITDVLTGVCNLVNVAGKGMVEQVNQKWQNVVKANPGKSIIVTTSVTVPASGEPGPLVIDIEPKK